MPENASPSPPLEQGAALVNGEISSLADARIPALDRGFLFGQAVFETLLILKGAPILWSDHIDRLERGCARILSGCPDRARLAEWARAVIAENIRLTGRTAEKMQLRIVVTAGSSMNLPLPRGADASPLRPNVVLLCRDAVLPAHARDGSGLTLKIHPDARSMELVDVKSSNYLWNLLALEAARARGFDDALFVNAQGDLTESTTANFLWFDASGRLCAAPLERHCLPGTTYLCLDRGLRARGRSIEQACLRPESLAQARGAAVISSVRGLVPVRRIDDHPYDVHALKKEIEGLNAILFDAQSRSIQSPHSM